MSNADYEAAFRQELQDLLNKYQADLSPAKEYEQYTGREYPIIEVTFDAIRNDVGQIIRPYRTIEL